jgi:hypothetical protein
MPVNSSAEFIAAAVETPVRGTSVTKTPSAASVRTIYCERMDEPNPFSKEIRPFKFLEYTDVFRGKLNPVWGDLAYDCYSQIQLWDSNGLAYGRDLSRITIAVRDLVKSAKSILRLRSPKAAAKQMADLFLSFRYGWSLTCKDTLSLLEMDYERAYPHGRCKRSSSFTYFRDGVTITARMAIYCRPYSNCISELAGFLQMIDLEITAENIWDLIPYSFVVDWVVNVGGLLDRLDILSKLDSFDIFLTGRSLKASTSLAADKIWQLSSCAGTVLARYYKRDYTSDVFPPSLASSRLFNQNYSHWLEGSALAVQRL